MPLGFENGLWLTMALGAFVLGHLVVLAYFLRASDTPPGPGMNGPTEPVPDAAGDAVGAARGDAEMPGELPPVESERIVQCSQCGVENAAEFRFCRFCVAELSDGTTVADPAGASRDGQAF